MINEKVFRKVSVAIVILILAILAFMIIRPVVISIIFGLILAYIFKPVYKIIKKIFKNPSLSALIICLFALLILFIPIWFLAPILLKQVLDIYISLQQVDIVSILSAIFPSSLLSEQFTVELTNAFDNFVSGTINLILNHVGDILLNLPNILFQLFIVLIVFFFSLRDADKLNEYIKSLSPFTKEAGQKFFEQSKAVTNAVIYGQIIAGLAQGIIIGIGFYIFGVPNALFLTIIATFASILPIIGAWLVWGPVAISFLLSGNTLAAIGLAIYGSLFVGWIDNLIRPYVVSKKTKVPTAMALIGMIGGLFVFGILGLVIGPLILAYLIILLDFYREKKFSSIFEEVE